MTTDLAALRARLESIETLPSESVRSLRDAVALEWTYHSNAIEGNTLTLKETKVVLEGITVGGKSMREHLEAINHASAIVFLEELAQQPTPLTERELREMHGLILRGIDDGSAGRWRGGNVLIAGAQHRPPDHLMVPEEMNRLFQEYSKMQERGAVECAAWLHREIVRVHPFADGNGRTSRLAMNLELMRSGWPPAIIRKEDRLRYYEALDLAHTTGDGGAFLSLVEERLAASLLLWLEVLGG